jgi:hypothetical protein
MEVCLDRYEPELKYETSYIQREKIKIN